MGISLGGTLPSSFTSPEYHYLRAYVEPHYVDLIHVPFRRSQRTHFATLVISSASDYTAPMQFEWDEQKNQVNIRKHGFSFADAWEVFEAPMLIDLDDRFNYGEERWIGIGRLQSRIVVVVYTEPSEEIIRIISLRKALSHERHAYEQAFGN